jgi:hypothetical protein
LNIEEWITGFVNAFLNNKNRWNNKKAKQKNCANRTVCASGLKPLGLRSPSSIATLIFAGTYNQEKDCRYILNPPWLIRE